jgi:hypothetical protein
MQNNPTPQIKAAAPIILRLIFTDLFILTLPPFLRFLRRGADGAHHGGGQTGFRL